MRRTLLAAAVAFVSGGIVTGSVLSQAQPAPPPAQQLDGSGGHWAGGWEHRQGPEGRPWMHHHGGMRAFALIYRQADRQLSPADVQKIVEGFLLWNGNHAWKVTDVAATPDGTIGFSLTTQEGSMVAKFTMDPHSAKIARVG